MPNSVQAITPLVGQIQIESEAHRDKGENAPLGCSITDRCLARSTNRLASGCCRSMRNGNKVWPNFAGRPGICPRSWAAAPRLARTYPRISFHLALPGLCRIPGEREREPLAAMERADKNINDLLEQLHGAFHQLRQSGIDEELFDVISGFEALVDRGSTCRKDGNENQLKGFSGAGGGRGQPQEMANSGSKRYRQIS